MQQNILIVDDDMQLTSFLARFLAKHRLEATISSTASQTRSILERDSFALIVLDLNLPDADGLEIAREIRSSSRTPIIMLTARDEVYDRIIGLELGADDYLTKPYEPLELLARIKAVLRRSQPLEDGNFEVANGAQRIAFAGFELDLVARQLNRGTEGEPVSLTGSEFVLLRALAERPGEVISRQTIMDRLYGNATTVTDRAIDAHITRLRRKIDAPDAGVSLIRAVHGEGYVLAAMVENS